MEPKSSRLQLLCNHLSSPRKQPEPVYSSLDFCFFDDLLSPEETKLRKEVREFVETEVVPTINDFCEKAEFPEQIVEKIGQKDWAKIVAKKPYGEERNLMLLALMTLELARGDASVASIFLLQSGVVVYTVEKFGSEEQKKALIPDMLKFKLISGWAVTEPTVGSDAANMTTAAKKVEGGYVLNGNKRWIGSANRQMVLTWARNQDSKKIECFIVPNTSKGMKVEVIKNKLAFRPIQNCNISYENVFVPEENRLPRADKGFGSISEVLEHSRVFVSWLAVGIAVGVYDNVIKYINNRKQFGVTISSFQLTQEKLARMMGHIQAMLLMVWRATRLYEAKRLTIGRVAMVKAWTTRMCREVAALGREMMGGNGIIIDNYAMKGLADIEGIYTYEGTYDINSLILGRELTGITAFK